MNNGYYPYSTGIADNPILHAPDTKQQVKNYKEEEKNQKAPPVLPFEIANAVEILGDVFVTLKTLRDQLEAVSRRGLNQSRVESVKEKIDTINKEILELSQDFDIIKL